MSIQAFLQDLLKAGLDGKAALAVAKPLWEQGIKSAAGLKTLNKWDDDRFARLGIEEHAKKLQSIGGKKSKRKRGSDMDNPLPNGEAPKPVIKQSLEFDESLEEFSLSSKVIVVNRAPVMTAWAMVVAEAIGFGREEALSVAQAYTDMNAQAKGQAIGVLPHSNQKDASGSSQPFVDLMGRKVPVLSLQNEEWRGIVKGKVCEPESAYGYIKRSFQQHAGAAVAAMRLLANSFKPTELNEKGYALYCDFRPAGSGWGEKSELVLKNLLDLRPPLVKEEEDVKPDIKAEEPEHLEDHQPSPAKKVKAEEDEFDDLDDLDYSAVELP